MTFPFHSKQTSIKRPVVYRVTVPNDFMHAVSFGQCFVTDDRYLIENALARLLTESHVIFLEYDENESFEAIIVIACTFSFPFPNKRLIRSLFQIKSDAYPRQIPSRSISVATEKCVEVTKRFHQVI